MLSEEQDHRSPTTTDPGVGQSTSPTERLRGFCGAAARLPTRLPGVAWQRHLVALLVLTIAFVGMLLPKLLPVGSGRILANSPADGSIFLWSIGWWPHAVASGDLLPYSHAVFAPGGVNLAWTTSIPVPSLMVMPVTHTFGIFAAFNLLSIAAPITAGWTTYLLVHRLTGRWAASLVAGSMFAMAPLETTEVAIGHLNLSLVALVPMAAYLVVRQLEGSITPWVFVAALGVVLAAQAGISTEILVTTTLFGAVAMALAYVICSADRAAIGRCAALMGLAYATAGVLLSPFLITAIAMPHPTGGPAIGRGISSVAGWTQPPRLRTAPRPAQHSVSHVGLLTALLLLPWMAVLSHLVWTRRGSRPLRALAVTALLAMACSAGAVAVGSHLVPTPWALVRSMPVLRFASPQRCSLFAWLIAATGVGLWLADPRTNPGRWLASLVIVAALAAQIIWVGSWTSFISTPPSTIVRTYISSGTNVAVVAGPGGSRSHQLDDLAIPTVWQAESGFSFRLADAYVGSLPPGLPSVARLFMLDRLPADRDSELRAWLRAADVRWVLVMHPSDVEGAAISRLLHAAPLRVEGVLYFRVAASSAIGTQPGT